MKFSFVISVYKTEPYLARCLDSLAAQTDGDFEAIVVDDASPGEECRRGVPAASSIVARYDARFRYVRQDRNRSTFQAKATGAKMATGDYIVPLDSDDYVLPRLVEELKRGIFPVDAASSPRQVGREIPSLTRQDAASTGTRQDAASTGTRQDAASTGTRQDAASTGTRQDAASTVVSQSNNQTIQQSNNSPDLIVYQMAKEFRGRVYPVKYNHPAGHCTGAEALEKLFAGRIFMPVCGKAIRREVFLAAYEGLGVGPDFYLNFTDDLCWLIPILLNTKAVTFIDYPGYRYWRHDDSMTKNVMAPEKVRLLAEQSRRSVAAVVAYAERLGDATSAPYGCGKMPHLRRGGILPPRSEKNISKDEANARLISEIRAQIYPTIRWLMRDMGQPRALLEEVYGADLVAETLRWDAASGGKLSKLLRHFRTYGLAATVREVFARCRRVEI